MRAASHRKVLHSAELLPLMERKTLMCRKNPVVSLQQQILKKKNTTIYLFKR